MKTKEIMAFIESKRIEKGTSKRDLCDLASVKESTYYAYLKGLEPPFCIVIRLLNALKMDLSVTKTEQNKLCIFTGLK